MAGVPAQQFAGVSAGDGRIRGKGVGKEWIFEVGAGLLRSQRNGRYPKNPPDLVRDRLEGNCAFPCAVQNATGRCLLDGEAKESGRVFPVDRGPAVCAVTDISRNARPASGRDQEWDKPVVFRAVNGGCQPHDAGPNSLSGESETGLLARYPIAAERLGAGRILLSADTTSCHHQRARGDDERFAGTGQALSKRMDRCGIAPSHTIGIGEIPAVGHVDDAVGSSGTLPQDVEILQRAAQNIRPEFAQAGVRLIRSCQPGHGVAGVDEFRDDRRTSLSRTASDEDMHARSLRDGKSSSLELSLSPAACTLNAGEYKKSSPSYILMDPLSDVLSLLKPRTYVTGGLAAGGQWSLHFPAHEGIKCYCVAKGKCWLAMDGVKEPFHLQTGSCYLLPHGRPFVLASDLTMQPRNARELLSTGERYNGIFSVSPGEDFLLLGSHFALEGDAHFLLDVLPPVAMLENESQRESLRWAVERMQREMRDPQPGGILIAQQVAYTLLVEALRLHLADDLQRGSGWLSALADSRMRAALSCMHGEPARAWTIQDLARSAGMSRTAFAQTFKRTVGTSPMDYLTQWRMTLAAKRMQDTGETISSIAPALGYKSESAFSAAFKRQWGTSPREHVRVHRSLSH